MESMNIGQAGNPDHDTAMAILQLQLEDVRDVELTRKGKNTEWSVSDSEMAFSQYRRDLENLHSVLKDRRMASSISTAVQTDGAIISSHRSHEIKAANDRRIAQNLGGRGQSHNGTTSQDEETDEVDDELLAKLRALYMSALDQRMTCSPDVGDGESSVSSTRKTVSTDDYRTCEACGDRTVFFDVARAHCGHEYCCECLRNLFESSMTDESLFPPRCCRQPITMASVRVFLSSDIVRSFEQKTIEFNTPNRTYCSRSTCSTFIPPERCAGDEASCPACEMVTCQICKSAAHEGDCPQDQALQQVLETAMEKGWQRCYSCHRIIELDLGCNHITCRCGAQFCYVCGERWKSCECDQWNEDLLFERAGQIIDRQPRDVDDPPRQQRLGQVAENLRERHMCEHRQWRFIPGPHRCEECYFQLPRYIFECRQCSIRVCNRCRRNRL